MTSREIDLAGAPARRSAWILRLFVRSIQIVFWLGVALARLPLLRVTRRSSAAALGVAITFLLQRLGATFIKVGQIMSTRPDIFPARFLSPFVALQDRVPPFGFEDVRRTIEEDFGRRLEEIFAEFEPEPVASASVAQVHRAVLQEAELPPSFPRPVVAVKVRRPGIVRRAYLDEAILRFGARCLSLVTTFALVSPVEAVAEFCAAVNKQLDFRIEAENNRRFRKNFESEPQAVFPALVDQLCSDRVLTMEFIDGVKEDKIRAIGNSPSVIARKNLEIVIKMVLHHGFVHADLHPGNVFFLPGNRIAYLDLGLVGELRHEDRRRFALLLYYVAANMGAAVARWFYEEAVTQRVRDYAAFEGEFAEMVAGLHDRPLEELQVAVLVAKAYGILRRHRIRPEATFTVANIAIVVAEGLGRKLDPKLSLTREARPYVEAALALRGKAAEPTPMLESPPTSLAAGRYRIRRLLGEGARKRVYLARDARLDRDVAVALIRTEGLDSSGLARINAEARAVAKLADHPRIVPVYDSGEEEGVPYVISQYMGGGTLSGRILRATDHRLPLDSVFRFADQICQALEHAHGHGVIHRDVKPENVWLTDDGFAKLGDFGLAQTVGVLDEDVDGTTVGTALYMAPEQALGRGVDHRSDLYSFGATLYELLTGRPPFEGDRVSEVISRHIDTNPEPPSKKLPEIPPALDALVLKLLAKAPEDRFESAAAVRQALRAAAAAGVSVVDDASNDELVIPAAGAFVGREHEIGRLRKGLEEALAGQGRLFMLVGEPGIGKTRLAELIAGYAVRRGGRMLSGRSFEGEGAPVYWPWVQILRSAIAGRDPAQLASELGPGAEHVAQIVPEIRSHLPNLPELPALEGEEARFRLFDAVTSFLKRAAAMQPLVLLLDDLHWADKPSLLLLHFVAREMSGARLLVIGAYRDVDVQYGGSLAEVLPSFRRERAFDRILLRGLPEDDVRALVAALAAPDVPDSFVRAIYRETEGNPFFIEETLRHLLEEGIVSHEGGRWTSSLSPEEIGLPEGVREVIGRRLSRLSDACKQLLTIAAVLGRDFDVRVLEKVAELEPGAVLDLLHEAMSAEIVHGESGAHRFSHALFRETLYADVRAAERVRVHSRIGEALEALYADDLEPHLSELAYHFLEAGVGGNLERAIDLATRAARRAAGQLAFEEAAGLYERALRALDGKGTTDERQRSELLLALAAAEWSAGEFAKSKQSVLRVAEVAGRSGDSEMLGRSAIAYSGGWHQPIATFDETQIDMLKKALVALGPEDSGLRATLLARLASAQVFFTDQKEVKELAEEALAIARRLGDSRTSAAVMLNCLWWAAAPDQLDERRSMSEALPRLGQELRDELVLIAGGFARFSSQAETGHHREALAALDGFERWVVRSRQTYFRWAFALFAAGWAFGTSAPAEAESLARRAFEIGSQGGQNLAALQVLAMQLSRALLEQGRLEEGEAALQQVIRTYGFNVPSSEVLAAFVSSEVGKQSEARHYLASVARNDFRDLPKNLAWFGIVLLAPVVERLADTKCAKVLYDLLLPYARRCAHWGHLVHEGSVSRFLGILAKTLSRLDEAAEHFDVAVEADTGMPAALARTRYEYARLLALRGAPADRARALSLLGEVLDTARLLGMKKLATEALALKLELEGVANEDVRGSIDAVTASIDGRRPDFRRLAAPDGTVTLMFSDMEDFSVMTERLGDRRAHEIVRAHNAIIREQLGLHGGFEVDSQGDGFLLAFSSAQRGLECAIAIQKTLASYSETHPEQAIRVRIGLHTGEAIKEGDKFFGRTVILAARIAARARGGEILASSLVRQLTEGRSEIGFGRLRELELKGLAGRHAVSAVLWNGELEEPVETEAPGATPPSAPNVFQKAGDFWTLSYEGKALSMRDAKGLHYIARLLRHPGREFHALDLVREMSLPGAPQTDDDTLPRLGDAGEALDPQAKAAYKARLDDLRSELEDARRRNDSDRANTLQEEIDFIAQELSAAYGLGGRARRSGDAAERARKAVQGRVSDTISRIRKEHPTLALHLSKSIRLGTFCAYVAESGLEWTL